MTNDYVEDIVSSVVSDYDDVQELIEELKSQSDLSKDELKDIILERLNDIDVYEHIYEILDNMVIYYGDSMDIIKELQFYSGWKSSIDTYLGGEVDNISQLAYIALQEAFDEEDGMDLIAEEILDAL